MTRRGHKFRWCATNGNQHVLGYLFFTMALWAHAMSEKHVSTQDENCSAMTVLFDGDCPLCRREIGVYQALSPLQPVAWQDVSQHTAGLSAADQARYMARFHVRLQDGRVLSGAAAFVALWLVMPGWRWLGRVGRLPGVTPVLELGYRGFLHLRPTLQRWARVAESANSK